MSKTYLPVVVFLASICVVFLPALHAQVERASIIGKITDSTGAAMAAVEVTVTNEATNTSIRVSSDDTGAFTAVNLIPGSYSVNASSRSFRPVVFRNFVLQVGQSARSISPWSWAMWSRPWKFSALPHCFRRRARPLAK
jgi:hypothetical protein